jgi:uncharacterized protein (DUF433 family)
VQDLREVPNYTIAEAARCLGIPVATLRSWFKGFARNGKAYKPFLRMSHESRLTFFEMMQADALFSMSKGNQTTLRTFRDQLRDLDPMDLVRKDVFYDRNSIYRQFAACFVSLRERGQTYQKSVIEPYLKRVRYDSRKVAYRIYPFTSRTDDLSISLANIVIDPKVCYGAVFHDKIGAPVTVLGKRFDLGDDEEVLAKDFGTTKEYIREAIRARNLIYVQQEAA